MENEHEHENHETQRKTIGGMNGAWGMLFKMALATYPCLIGWSVWVTSETYANRHFRLQGDRVTPEDLRDLERHIDRRIDALPPIDWRERIEKVETKLDDTRSGVLRVETIVTEVVRRLQALEEG